MAELTIDSVQLRLTTDRASYGHVLFWERHPWPGASLGGRSPTTLTIPALERWLQCRAALTKGKKADLIDRLYGIYMIQNSIAF